MTSFFYMPNSHGKNDIGWKQVKGNPFEHWFHSSDVSAVAISHCNLVRYKVDFINPQNNPHCPYCKMIEELRDGLDNLNERSVEISKLPLRTYQSKPKSKSKSKSRKGK